MAYNDHCSSVGISCTRLNRWSNPLLTYNGDSTGRPIGATQPADEAYAFYRMACVVAGFRPVGSGCATPTSLNTTNISTTNATLNWTAASGAVSYDVEYKTSAETNWTAAATGTTATSVNLSSLNAATTYNWRVRTNCSGGTTSSFATASFATDALCATPGGLSSTNITSNSATLTWGAVSGASSYTIEIKTSVATTWSVLAAGYTNTSILATGLVSGATYNWRVNATCPAGTGAFATASFATQVVACTDAWEPNESRTAARSITTGTAIQGLISSSSDNDYFKFSNSTAAPNIRITLTNLPANYNIELYRTGVNKRVAVSANSGTTSETITLNNAAIGQYEVRVYGNSRNEFNTINCYTLQANVSNIAYDQADNDKAEWGPAAGGITVYPQPATGVLNIAFDAVASGKTEVALVNQLGMNLQQKNMTASKGTNFTTLDVSLTPTGIYVLKITQNGVVKTARVLVQKR
jgi:hypothetical protein